LSLGVSLSAPRSIVLAPADRHLGRDFFPCGLVGLISRALQVGSPAASSLPPLRASSSARALPALQVPLRAAPKIIEGPKNWAFDFNGLFAYPVQSRLDYPVQSAIGLPPLVFLKILTLFVSFLLTFFVSFLMIFVHGWDYLVPFCRDL
jgi:hypothetical protein